MAKSAAISREEQCFKLTSATVLALVAAYIALAELPTQLGEFIMST